MSESRATRRQRGIVQNAANQLAQMAVGWQTMFEGPALAGEPDTGVMEIDAVSSTGTINGRPAELFMAMYLKDWLERDLAARKLEWSRLLEARVRVGSLDECATPSRCELRARGVRGRS